jgi:hypothetical protein
MTDETREAWQTRIYTEIYRAVKTAPQPPMALAAMCAVTAGLAVEQKVTLKDFTKAMRKLYLIALHDLKSDAS